MMKKIIVLGMFASLSLVTACEPDAGAVLPGSYPQTSSLGISADGKTLYVALADHDQVRAVDVESGSVTGETAVAGYPHRLTVMKDGRVAVSSRHAGTVSVLNASSTEVLSTTEVGADPFGVVEADGHLVVALAGQAELARIPTNDTMRVSDRVALNAAEPRGLAVDASGKLFVSHFKGGKISSVDLGRGVVDDEMKLQMAANPHFEANQLDTITTSPDGDEIAVPHDECNNDPSQFGGDGTNFGGGAEVEYYAMGPTGHPAVVPAVSRVDTTLRVHLSDGPGVFDVNFPEGK
jgi:sugar lactone lactonase YvrE